MTDIAQPRLLYFADTMCSWCYGFAPEMNRVLLALGDEIALSLQAGGLRPFSTEVMTDAMKPRFRGYREAVQARTGQPFDWGFFARDGYVMDTEPASRAVVTLRALKPASAYAYMHAIQRAFFAANADIRDPEVLAAHAEGFDVPAAAFTEMFGSEAAKEATLEDFRLAQRFQVTGFPTLFLLKGRTAYQIAVGYDEAGPIVERVRRAIAHQE
jgi:putative protein-disulfide isomerase